MNHGPDVNEAFDLALEARKKAYAPYSKFLVGATFKLGDNFFSGFNIENSSYPASICAERAAICNMLTKSSRNVSPEFLVVVTDTEYALGPCGVCLQVLTEFCSPDMPVYNANLQGVKDKFVLGELISFNSKEFNATLTKG